MIFVSDIMRAVAAEHKISVEDLTGKRMLREHSWPRQEAFLLAREMTGHSLPRIGQFFGHRDHSTVLEGIRRAKARYEADPDVRRRIDALSVGLLIQ